MKKINISGNEIEFDSLSDREQEIYYSGYYTGSGHSILFVIAFSLGIAIFATIFS